MQSRIRLINAVQQMLREFERRELAGFQQRSKLCQSHPRQRHVESPLAMQYYLLCAGIMPEIGAYAPTLKRDQKRWLVD